MKYEIELPDVIQVGRNGAHGTLNVDWSRVPATVRDHIASVYFPQYISDAANAGGTDETSEERMARAQKKLDTMYAGDIRAHRASSEPVDPVEREAFRAARERIEAGFRLMKIWPAKGRNKFDAAVATRAEQLGTEMTTEQYILGYLDKNPKVRADAKRTVAQRAKDVVDAGELV